MLLFPESFGNLHKILVLHWTTSYFKFPFSDDIEICGLISFSKSNLISRKSSDCQEGIDPLEVNIRQLVEHLHSFQKVQVVLHLVLLYFLYAFSAFILSWYSTLKLLKVSSVHFQQVALFQTSILIRLLFFHWLFHQFSSPHYSHCSSSLIHSQQIFFR